MLFKKTIRFYPVFLFLSWCNLSADGQSQAPPLKTVADTARTDAFMDDLFKKALPILSDTSYRTQVIYTRIDRGANGIAGLKNYYFRVNPAQYCNPAQAVRLPVAMMVLQKLSGLKLSGVDKNTTMLTGKAYSGQTAVYNEPTAPSGKPTIAQYFKKMMLVGDESSYNRLYELLGQQYINEQLMQKGYMSAQIIRRLGEGYTGEEDRHTNPITFYAPGNKVLLEQAAQFNSTSFEERHDTLNGEDFSNRNKISLADLHTMLVSVIFPNKVTSAQRFALTDDDRKYLLKYMSEWPTESFNPPYGDDTASYHPALTKYLLYGSERDSISNNIRIFNVSGWEGAQLIDVAYIVDFDKKIEFFLSATVNCSTDEKAETNGLAFMKQLGKLIYEYETKREKNIQPDLSDVKFEYDGR